MSDQNSQSKALAVRSDAGMPLISDPTVRMRKFQYTSLDTNSNKEYRYELRDLPDGNVHVVGHWGRVGDKGQSNDYGAMSPAAFESMVRERLRKGYHEVELHQVQHVTSRAGVDTTTREGQLVALLYKEAGEAIEQYLSVSVDALSQNQLDLGRMLLGSINSNKGMTLLKGMRAGKVLLAQAIEAYYKAIPTKLPRRIDAEALVGEFDPSEQETRLDQLEAAIKTYQAVQGGATQTSAMGAEIAWLDPQTHPDAHNSLRQWVETTGKRGGGMYASGSVRVADIYEITIPDERERYRQFVATLDASDAANKRLLFHGSRNANWRHILRGGLRIMSSVANGRALGNGLYFADQSGKSANYCANSGYQSSAPLMMVVCEVALGRISKRNSWNGNSPPPGYDSVFSEAHGGYAFNEYCVFEPARCTARYLITFRTS